MSLSGILKKKLGFSATFVLGIVGALLAMAYIWFFIKDSRDLRPQEVEDELQRMKVRF